MTEEWRDIKGFEGLYQVSNQGKVKSLNYNHTGNEKLLKQIKYKCGYLYVVLCLNGKCKPFRIHRLVAQSFIPNPDNLPIINHKDEDKLNNSVDNLEWCTYKYNNCYGTRLEKVYKKVACYKDNKLIKIYNAIRDVDKDGFYNQNVWKCCNGKRKSHGGFNWRYI